MANKDWPCGMHPVRMKDGQASYTTRWPLKGTSSLANATAIYKGQVVLFNRTYQYVRGNAATNPGAGDILGVAAEYFGGRAVHTTKTDIAIYDANKHVFAIQADNTTTTSTAAALLGKKASLVNPSTGSTITGLSTSELDFSSAVTNTDKPLTIIGHTGEIGEGTGINVKCLVEFTFGHVYAQDATGIY